MNQSKEKSAVGTAIPATENIKNYYTDSIAENSGKIKCYKHEKINISQLKEYTFDYLSENRENIDVEYAFEYIADFVKYLEKKAEEA